MDSDQKSTEKSPVLGFEAESPRQLPRRSWPSILMRVGKSFSDHQLGLIAAGIAFYCFLGLFPALAALVSIYGFFVDPTTLESQISTYLAAFPIEVREILTTQLKRISESGLAGRTAIFAAAVALWGGSKSAAAFMRGMNVVYRENEDRGFIKGRITALFLTTGVLLVVLVGIGLLAGVPVAMRFVRMGEWSESLILIFRWPGFVMLLLYALAILYRFGPDRTDAKWRWITPGALLAAVLVVASSWGFGQLISRFTDFNATYGSLGAVVVLLLWLQVMAIVILFGGLLNAHMEYQTGQDTTVGEEKPAGERGAFMADNRPPE